MATLDKHLRGISHHRAQFSFSFGGNGGRSGYHFGDQLVPDSELRCSTYTISFNPQNKCVQGRCLSSIGKKTKGQRNSLTEQAVVIIRANIY